MSKVLVREILYWAVILFFSVYLVNHFFTGGDEQEVLYLVFFSGVLLVSVGTKLVVDHDPDQLSLSNAIKKAREKSFVWWMPFLGILVMAAGVIGVFYMDVISMVPKLIMMFLAIVIATLTLERLNRD
jgi:archaellum biogenesis protein FlaJ (TadC family)